MNTSTIILSAVLFLEIAAKPSLAQHKYLDDGRFVEFFFSPDNVAPDRTKYNRIPVLVETEGKIFLAVDQKIEFNSACRYLGGWIAIGFDARREDKHTGLIMTAKVGIREPIPEHFIQYPLDGDDLALSFGDDRKQGKRWEWKKANGGGYYLAAIDGKYAGWVMDFENKEEAVFKRVASGGETFEHAYLRWPAKLSKEPGKMSRLFLKYPTAGPGARDKPAK